MREFAFQLGAFVLYALLLCVSILIGTKISKATGRSWLGVLSGVLVFGAIGVWAFIEGTNAAWVAFGVATLFLVISGVVKYAWPGKNLKNAGVATRSIVIGAVLGIVGFFVVPVLGLPIGFVIGCFLSELQRTNGGEAWRATIHALKAVGLSILVELVGALLAAGVWLGAVLFA